MLVNFKKTITYRAYKDQGLAPTVNLIRISDKQALDGSVCVVGGEGQSVHIIAPENAVSVPDFLGAMSNLSLDLNESGYSALNWYRCSEVEFEAISEDYQHSASNKSYEQSDDTEQLRALNSLVYKALQQKASDIHFYIHADGSGTITFDVNDVPREIESRPKQYIDALVNASLSSQGENYSGTGSDFERVDDAIILSVRDDDGTFFADVKLRTSKISTPAGAHTVMRINRTNQVTQTFEELGIAKDVIDMYETLAAEASGIVVIAGPTAAGKTTTLATFFESIHPDRKLVVMGDPIENLFNRPNVVPISINAKKSGFGYRDYIESALRLAPKAISIAEVRTSDVLHEVFNIALTGHLVGTTYHADDAKGAIDRLLKDGIPPHLAGAGVIKAISSQRLLKRLCDKCKRPGVHPVYGNVSYVGSGCDCCDKGFMERRLNVSELLMFDAVINRLIADSDIDGVMAHAKKNGFVSMAERTVKLIEMGFVDPLDAIARVPKMIDAPAYVYRKVGNE
jgi:type II secretory ATPase GspE/PulE/Tfp pilus assembly ATPase PilB-like protein